MDVQVGETFKVPGSCPAVTVDGYVDPSGQLLVEHYSVSLFLILCWFLLPFYFTNNSIIIIASIITMTCNIINHHCIAEPIRLPTCYFRWEPVLPRSAV